jgi:hypothetical protein
MKQVAAFIITFCFSSLMFGQVNLVRNPGFEDTLRCLSDSSIFVTKNWYRPTACGTPDFYYPTQQNVQCVAEFPQVWGGGDFINSRGNQLPHSGSAYAGMGVSLGSELLAVSLTDSLKYGNTYVVTFYVSIAEVSLAALDQINLSFMRDSITDFNITTCWTYLGNLNVSASNQAGNILSDSVDWMQVQDTFVASGGELYMLVGNIDTAATLYQYFDSTFQKGAYYYFDDFDVHCIDCTSDTSEPPVFPVITISPTLTQGEINLSGDFPAGTKLEVYDVLGQLVYYDEMQSGNQTQTVFLQLSAGVYTCRVMAEGNVLKTEKVVVTK